MARNNYSNLFDLIGVLARRRYLAGEKGFATLGLNHTEARLLTLLDQEHGEATQDALSNMLYVDRSNAGRALKGLEQHGYVTRSQDVSDRRTRVVKMTPKGRQTAAKIAKVGSEMAQTFFGDLTEEQAGMIADLLRGAMGLGEPPATSEEGV